MQIPQNQLPANLPSTSALPSHYSQYPQYAYASTFQGPILNHTQSTSGSQRPLQSPSGTLPSIAPPPGFSSTTQYQQIPSQMDYSYAEYPPAPIPSSFSLSPSHLAPLNLSSLHHISRVSSTHSPVYQYSASPQYQASSSLPTYSQILPQPMASTTPSMPSRGNGSHAIQYHPTTASSANRAAVSPSLAPNLPNYSHQSSYSGYPQPTHADAAAYHHQLQQQHYSNLQHLNPHQTSLSQVPISQSELPHQAETSTQSQLDAAENEIGNTKRRSTRARKPVVTLQAELQPLVHPTAPRSTPKKFTKSAHKGPVDESSDVEDLESPSCLEPEYLTAYPNLSMDIKGRIREEYVKYMLSLRSRQQRLIKAWEESEAVRYPIHTC